MEERCKEIMTFDVSKTGLVILKKQFRKGWDEILTVIAERIVNLY